MPLADYAYNLGIAFQLVDDILDVISDPVAPGKPSAPIWPRGGAFVTQPNGQTICRCARPRMRRRPRPPLPDVVAVARSRRRAAGRGRPVARMMSKLRTSGPSKPPACKLWR